VLKKLSTLVLFEDSSNNPYQSEITEFLSSQIIVLLIFVAWFATGAIFAYFIWKDGIKRERSTMYYAILTVATSAIGLIVYLIVRYNELCALESDEKACEYDMIGQEVEEIKQEKVELEIE
jgi:hypothetical protein